MIDVTNDLAVFRGFTGAYTAAITAHSTPDDAISVQGGRETLFGGSAEIIEVTQGLDVHLFEITPAKAEVTSGFMRFLGPSTSRPLVGQAKLGWVRVAPKELDDSVEILNARTGEEVATQDLVAVRGVNIRVDGDLSVGAFHFIEDSLNAAGARSATCPGADASTDRPDRGTLVDDQDVLLISDAGEIPDVNLGFSGNLDAQSAGDRQVYSLCVNVDVLGKETNRKPIPNAGYTGTVLVKGPALGADTVAAGTGPVGRIQRNGTAVKIAYLTVSEKYDQRLIITNRGLAPALFVLSEFVTGPGTTVGLSASAEAARLAGLNVVPPFEQVVLKMSDLLTFSGDRKRASATLALNADVRDIQVATVQTNILDGSTDTVIFPAEPGPGL